MALTTDSSTNNFQLTAFGNTLVVAGSGNPPFGGGSAYFDGTGDYLELPANEAFAFGNGDFTIELWHYSTTSPAFETLLSRWDSPQIFFLGGGVSYGYQFYVNGTLTVNGGTYTSNQWNHVAVSRNGSNLRMFINGIRVGSTYDMTGVSFTVANNVQLRIGADYNVNPKFTGYIDDLRITKGIGRYITNFTLPTQQLFDPSDPNSDNVSLLLHMDNLSGSQTFIDSSSNNFTLSAFGNTTISLSTKKFGNGAGYFDGNGDYLKANWDSAFTFGTGDFTVEFWAYPTGTPNGIGFITAEYNPGSIGNVAWTFGAASSLGAASGSQLFFGSYEGGWTGVQSVSSLTLSAWSHIAASRSSGTLRLFLNGVNIAQDTFTNNISTGDPLIIGRRWDHNEVSKFFNGYIDELRITKGVARYNSNFVPQTAPFANRSLVPAGYVAFWKLDDVTDSSANANNLTNYNSVQFVAGKIGNCAEFNATNYLNNSSLTPTFNPDGEFTCSIWIYPYSFSHYQAFIGGPVNSFIIHTDSDGSLYCNEAGAGDAIILSVLQLNQWQHIVFIKSLDGNTKVWYNGTNIYNQPTNNSGNYQPFTSIVLGNIGGLSFSYDGKLDMVGFWNRELTELEIATLYNNGNGVEP